MSLNNIIILFLNRFNVVIFISILIIGILQNIMEHLLKKRLVEMKMISFGWSWSSVVLGQLLILLNRRKEIF